MGKKLLHIFYQEPPDGPTIREYINSVKRLCELVAIEQSDTLHPGISNAIYISESRIHIRPDWLEQRPAILFPSEIPFNKAYLLGTVFGLLRNEEKYPQYFIGYPAMLYAFDLIQAISNGDECDGVLEKMLSRNKFAHPFENYLFNHNVAVALNHGHYSQELNPAAIAAHYEDAIQLAFEPSYKAYTLKYFATFLTDLGYAAGALKLLSEHPLKSPDDYPKYALERSWCAAAMKHPDFPGDTDLLAELKDRLWNTLQFFDGGGHKTVAGLLWMDAATVATIGRSYTEALGYISKAIAYLEEEEQQEMSGGAQMVRARLFHDWAQSGNPQFYRTAMEAYQEALKVFSKDAAPEVFADIHHQLGIIYAELPDDAKKRAIWAALSAASFGEALACYNKVEHPAEFGTICNNFGNAYLKYPQGLRTDNTEKALDYYRESLSVRDAAHFPAERAVTLLNYLEASWKAGNPDTDFNTERFDDMRSKAEEIKMLAADAQLLGAADKHLDLLTRLAAVVQEENAVAGNA